MRKPAGDPPARAPADAGERLRWIAVAANDISDILLRADPAQLDLRLAQAAKRHAKSLGIGPADIEAATLVARKKLIELAAALDVKVPPGSDASKLLLAPEENAAARQLRDQAVADPLAPLALQATPTDAGTEGELAALDLGHVAETLTAGIQDITNAMVDDFKLSDVLRMILETMFRAMKFQHIVFCMRDPKTDTLTGRFGLGPGVERIVKAFDISLKEERPDLFSAVCLKAADTMINDATEARIAARLPAWYRLSVDAPAFLLLPLTIKGKPFGLIYADKGEKNALALNEKELSLLRTLRNQAVMAFKQSS